MRQASARLGCSFAAHHHDKILAAGWQAAEETGSKGATTKASVHVGVLVLVICACVCVGFDLRISVRERINAWVTDPHVQPFYSDSIQSRDIRIAILRRQW